MKSAAWALTGRSKRSRTEDMVWETVVKTLGGAAILCAMVGWLCRSIILHFLEKDVGKYKEELRGVTEAQIAECRHRLDVVRLEHQVRFSKLHEERFDCLKVLSTKAWELWVVLSRVVTSGEEERTKNAQVAIQEFVDHLFRVEILLPKDFAERWNKTLDESARAVRHFQIATTARTPDWERDAERQQAATTRLIELVGQIRKELLQEGRSILEKGLSEK